MKTPPPLTLTQRFHLAELATISPATIERMAVATGSPSAAASRKMLDVLEWRGFARRIKPLKRKGRQGRPRLRFEITARGRKALEAGL